MTRNGGSQPPTLQTRAPARGSATARTRAQRSNFRNRRNGAHLRKALWQPLLGAMPTIRAERLVAASSSGTSSADTGPHRFALQPDRSHVAAATSLLARSFPRESSLHHGEADSSAASATALFPVDASPPPGNPFPPPQPPPLPPPLSPPPLNHLPTMARYEYPVAEHAITFTVLFLVLLVWGMSGVISRAMQRYLDRNRKSRVTRLVGSTLDVVLLLVRLVPRSYAVLVLATLWLAMLSQILTDVTLTPSLMTALLWCLGYLPSVSLLFLLFHDLALLFRAIPVPRHRPLHALTLALTSLIIQSVATGELSEVLYFLALPSVATSGYFQAWWAVLIIPFSVGAVSLYLLIKCCRCACRWTLWGIGAAIDTFTGTIRSSATDVAQVPGVPPLVDLVSNRNSWSYLGRALFIYPVAIATTFTFGLSWLLLPSQPADPSVAAYELQPLCPGPLTDRISGLGASGLYWLMVLATGNSPGFARTVVSSICGFTVPATASLPQVQTHMFPTCRTPLARIICAAFAFLLSDIPC